VLAESPPIEILSLLIEALIIVINSLNNLIFSAKEVLYIKSHTRVILITGKSNRFRICVNKALKNAIKV